MWKTVHVEANVKTELDDFAKGQEFKKASDVIAYLLAMQEMFADKITHKQHQESLRRAEELNAQQVW
ncbi:hypothetical protein [Paenibacillus sp. LHD-38]|uniref:hypothetical protein n=1 Tax=Paenibacillus sp. LHD-38 TaxID=3072143 RepID=UPI00280E815F|nr:hypothetical protein [Paenibacillus sp. LHD-38]MDQ8738155.1 hypothetical protein [Paenibacillus sp. LHD-38]